MTSRPTFGPWRPGLADAELRARCRSLRAVAGLLAGPRADALCAALLAAETDPSALDLAADELDRLAPLDMRRVLASYGQRAAPPRAYVNPQACPTTRATPRSRDHRDALPRHRSDALGFGSRRAGLGTGRGHECATRRSAGAGTSGRREKQAREAAC